MRSKVSIIVPVYNVERYLSKCINSILNQTYQDFEIIMIDDCSSDNSLSIAQEYASSYPGIVTLICHDKNKKLASARNTGLKAVTGQWVTFLDSDDWIDENYLAEMVKVAEEDNSDIVACSYYHFWDSGKKIEMYPFGHLTTQSSQKEKVALMRNHACMRLYRKQFLDIHGLVFPENIQRAEDMGFTIPLMTRTEAISILKKPLYYYYQRPNSISNSNKNIDISFYQSAFDVLIKNCMSGFEREIEYRAINEFMYGLIMIMIKGNKSNREICSHIDGFNETYSAWLDNSYLQYMPKTKKVFVKFSSKKRIMALRVLVSIFNYLKALRSK